MSNSSNSSGAIILPTGNNTIYTTSGTYTVSNNASYSVSVNSAWQNPHENLLSIIDYIPMWLTKKYLSKSQYLFVLYECEDQKFIQCCNTITKENAKRKIKEIIVRWGTE